MLGAFEVDWMSFCRFLIFWFVFARWNFTVFLTISLMYVLKNSQRVCGFSDFVLFSDVFLKSISLCSLIPHSSIAFVRVLSDSRLNGQVHLPFLM
jgi:hypothetical protein